MVHLPLSTPINRRNNYNIHMYPNLQQANKKNRSTKKICL